ncbi:MAG TPA: hypothetical protein VH796_02550 [Nitrososphaeraceae archaeon]
MREQIKPMALISTILLLSTVGPGIALAQDSITSGETPWQEFGLFIGPTQKHTRLFHNENGVFIPWAKLCSSAQSYLLQSCSSLINPDGSLTSVGDKAVGCITNGAILTIAAKKYLGMQTGTIGNVLNFLAKPTGCDGIVDLNNAQNSPDLERLVNYASNATQ